MFYAKYRDFAGKPFYFGPFDTYAEALAYQGQTREDYPYEFAGVVHLATEPRFVNLP